MAGLSGREDQILRFIVSGSRNKLIARDLGISEATVKVHVRALLRKLGATNRTQAAILGMNWGKTADVVPVVARNWPLTGSLTIQNSDPDTLSLR
jgi:two-component system nitrate/nitrite response regulator NarL